MVRRDSSDGTKVVLELLSYCSPPAQTGVRIREVYGSGGIAEGYQRRGVSLSPLPHHLVQPLKITPCFSIFAFTKTSRSRFSFAARILRNDGDTVVAGDSTPSPYAPSTRPSTLILTARQGKWLIRRRTTTRWKKLVMSDSRLRRRW